MSQKKKIKIFSIEMALLGHFNPNGPRAISIQMAQQGHFNPVQVDSALNHPLKCLVIGPVIGKEVSKIVNEAFRVLIFVRTFGK